VQDRRALAVALEISRVWRPDLVVVLGDFLDADAWSAHPRSSVEDKPGSFLRTEVVPGNALLDRFAGRAERPLVYIEGNHEHRVTRWCARNAGRLGEDVALLTSPMRLLSHRVDARGRPGRTRKNFTWVPYLGRGLHSHYKIAPDLVAIHGWSIAANASKVHLDKARSFSIVHGHTHRAQSYVGRCPLTGKIYQAWSPGFLGGLVPDYMSHQPGDWSHGVTCIYQSVRNRRDWTQYTVPIDRGRAVLPDGREVRA
jgi:predicted phosphodiesterase